LAVVVVLLATAADSPRNGDPTVNDVESSPNLFLQPFSDSGRSMNDFLSDSESLLPFLRHHTAHPIQRHLQPDNTPVSRIGNFQMFAPLGSPIGSPMGPAAMFPQFHNPFAMQQPSSFASPFQSPMFFPTQQQMPIHMNNVLTPMQFGGAENRGAGFGDGQADEVDGRGQFDANPMVEIHSSSLPDFLADLLSQRLGGRSLSSKQPDYNDNEIDDDEPVEKTRDAVPSPFPVQPALSLDDTKADFYLVHGWFPQVDKKDALRMKVLGSSLAVTIGGNDQAATHEELLELPYAPNPKFCKAHFDEATHMLTVVFPKELKTDVPIA